MVIKRFYILVLIGLMLSGCSSKKRIVTKKKNESPRTEQVIVKTKTDDRSTEAETPSEILVNPDVRPTFANTTEGYIHNYNEIAKEEMRKYKIPASITLAQGILESASGKGRLAMEANNHFGIKCHNWEGQKIYHDDDRSQECFRKYKHAEESFEDHSAFLTTRSRYANLFKLDEDDYEGWAKGLRAAGYATDRKYPEKLIDIIERFDLHKYDEEVLGTGKKSRKKPRETATVVSINNRVTHEVVKGDTMYSLSKRYNMTVQELQKLNKMTDNTIQLGQLLIVKSN